MTTFPDKTLTRDKLQRLIHQARHLVTAPDNPVDASDFDWKQPHHFGPKHLALFESFSKKLEYQIDRTFETLCQGPFEAKVTSTSQDYAWALVEQVQVSRQKEYFLPFNIDQQPQTGFLALAPATAVALIGYMLRDGDFATGEIRNLSGLEESILMDFASALGEAVNTAFHLSSGPGLQFASQLNIGDWPMLIRGLEDLFTIVVTITCPQGPIEMSITFLASAIESVFGIQRQAGSKHSAKELNDRIMTNMHKAPVEIVARVAQAFISLNDVMNLVPGDTIILNKKIDTPIDLLVNQRPCFQAFPARSSGKYAVVVAPRKKD